ncbi:hypothetical protein NCCP1664_02560 [Zafaria cholistanensis]|uniref:Uncharacterized protein n=1 Tax=Zafaria cholistanensis TaxID=1682741 RepID=A0A5A7NMH9_9MICC|nr:hypothetical protein NCCP1664_02560 [Zafaria cholistanensis]
MRRTPLHSGQTVSESSLKDWTVSNAWSQSLQEYTYVGMGSLSEGCWSGEPGKPGPVPDRVRNSASGNSAFGNAALALQPRECQFYITAPAVGKTT